ncbi:MAG TPA: orotidine-5'-phosphate decarboxylase [Anaerolineales bacterium]|nr:orotidine-5'-phosphate decarboxylase [Anaerolineales bacterium]
MTFFSRLESRIREIDSLLCVGLDPHLDELSAAEPKAALDFCLDLIENCAEFAATFKPNSAFFEAIGPQGMGVLRDVIAAVPEGIPVILDAKRGDIAATAQAYAHAVFEQMGADAVTLNPYLGFDSLEPFLHDPDKGVFLLCKTTNPGAQDLQDQLLPGGLPLHLQVARLANNWNRSDNLGLVIGATQPVALARVRAISPDLWFLTPGVGAQGGDLEEALRAGLRLDGMGMLISVSRGISQAKNPHQAAKELREKINEIRRRIRPGLSKSGFSAQAGRPLDLADDLLESGCIQFGEFTLKSGLFSPIYIDLRRLAGFPRLLARIAAAYLPILQGVSFDRLAAVPYAALPIATAISLQSGWPLVYPRKETKEYGTRAEVEGLYEPGERVVVIDDLTTTGSSKFEVIDKLTSAGLQVQDIVVLIDRQSGAAQALAESGYKLHAIFSLTQMLDHWESAKRVSKDLTGPVRAFLGRGD